MQLLERDLDTWELEQLLSGKYDNSGCRLTIMAGAGGTEAQDWALMLQRMYLRFFQRRGFKYRIVEEEVRGAGRGGQRVGEGGHRGGRRIDTFFFRDFFCLLWTFGAPLVSVNL